jgi:hypothetical protein
VPTKWASKGRRQQERNFAEVSPTKKRKELPRSTVSPFSCGEGPAKPGMRSLATRAVKVRLRCKVILP